MAVRFLLLVLVAIANVAAQRAEITPGNESKTEAASRSTVDALVSEASDLEKGGRFAESEKLLSGALKRFSDPESQKRLAIAQADLHFSRGYDLEKKYAFEEAIAHYTTALEIDRQYRRDRAAIDINNIGAVLFRAGQFEAAIKCYEQSLVIRREVRDRAGEGRVLDNLGTAHYRLGDFEKALAYYRQALVIRREVGDAKGEVTTLVKIGNVCGQFGQLEEAIGSYEQALTVARTAKLRDQEAAALCSLGAAYNSMGRNPKALEYTEQALRLAREVKDRETENTCLNNLGSIFSDLGRYDKALEYYEQALAIRRETRDRFGEGTTLGNMGTTLQHLGQFKKAVECYQQALAIARELKDRAGEAAALSNLGGAYSNLDQTQRAIECYEQALAIRRDVKDPAGEASTLNNLGGAYASLGKFQKAIPYFERALKIQRQVKDRQGENATLYNLGQAYGFTGKLDKATGYLEQALAKARESQDILGEGAALTRLMAAWQARRKPQRAIFYGKIAVNVWQKMRTDLQKLDREMRESFFEDKAQTYRDLADLLASQGRLEEAQQILWMLKDEEYLEFVRGDAMAAPPQAGGAPELSPLERSWEQRYSELGGRVAANGARRSALLAKQTLTPPERQELEHLEEDAQVAMRGFQKALGELANAFDAPQQAADKVAELKESEGLMQDLRDLGQGVVALQTIVGRDKYRVILITPDTIKQGEYPITRSELERKVDTFCAQLRDPRSDPLPLAQELYKILIGPVAVELEGAQAQTLMWSLDGKLRYLPISALHDGKKYVVERYRSVIFTLASRLRLKDTPTLKWTALGLGVSKPVSGFSALPAVREELASIVRSGSGETQGVMTGDVLLDEAFTEQSLREALRKGHPLVHIASHFLLGDEGDSFLLLGDGSRLTLERIALIPNFFAGVELLTLSACETALRGRGAGGQELESFGELVQRKGAKAVIASLWPVADESTSLLMQRFYAARAMQPGIPKAEALRQAQLELLRGSAGGSKGTARFEHPLYWAPFVLIGNWR